MKKNIFGRSMALLLVMTLGALVFAYPDFAEAKKKSNALKLDYKVDTIYRYETAFAKYAIRNYHSKAKYKFKSLNRKVASVTKKGTIRGLRPGKAKILITERYRGKTKKAKLTIRVLGVKLQWKKADIFRGQEDYRDDFFENLHNSSPKAKYIFKSMDTTKLEVYSSGLVKKAKKLGTVKVAAYEKYKKKSRLIGYITVTIKPAVFESNNKTIKMKWHGRINHEDYDDDIYEITDDIIGWDECVIIICGTKADIDELAADPKEAITGEPSNNDKVLKFEIDEDGAFTGRLLARGVGTRFAAVFDTTDKSDPMYIGYCKIVVSKGKGAK